jgi:hypothetical protein
VLHYKIETKSSACGCAIGAALALRSALSFIHKRRYSRRVISQCVEPGMYFRGQYRFFILVLVLTAGAGLLTLLITDIDVFEAKTGFFSAVGTFVINALVAIVGLLAAFYAISIFFPKRWGPKAGIVGAIVCALVAAFCLRALLLGGAS